MWCACAVIGPMAPDRSEPLQGTLCVLSSSLGYESARSALSAAVSAVRCAGGDVARGQDPSAEVPFRTVNQPPPVWNIRVLTKHRPPNAGRTPAAITAHGKPGLHALLRRTNQKRR